MAKVITKNNNLSFKSHRRFVRTTPDKLRLVARPVIGKNVNQALSLLEFSGKAAQKPLSLTIKSAVAIAKENNLGDKELYIRSILINEGPKLKRRRIVHQGRATAILKRMSHITVILTDERKSKIQKSKSKINQNDKIINPKK